MRSQVGMLHGNKANARYYMCLRFILCYVTAVQFVFEVSELSLNCSFTF